MEILSTKTTVVVEIATSTWTMVVLPSLMDLAPKWDQRNTFLTLEEVRNKSFLVSQTSPTRQTPSIGDLMVQDVIATFIMEMVGSIIPLNFLQKLAWSLILCFKTTWERIKRTINTYIDVMAVLLTLRKNYHPELKLLNRQLLMGQMVLLLILEEELLQVKLQA